MRRKSERTATKKAKSSPEKKVEKAKRTRTRRRKQSSSSDNESGEDSSPVREVVPVVEEEAAKKPPVTPVKEDSPEEAQSVWHVKTTDSSDGGEIKKLKICLARPPSTPERVDRSPRSRRKQSRATSSSDTASVEPVEDRRKSKRSKRMTRESKDDSDKNHDSQGEEPETESEPTVDKSDNEISQSTEVRKESDQTPMSTTNEEAKDEKSVDSTAKEDVSQNKESKQEQSKSSDADTTVASPRPESQGSQSESNAEKETQSQVTEKESSSDSTTGNKSQDNDEKNDQTKKETDNESHSENKNDKKTSTSESQKENQSDNNTETKSDEAENKTPERDSIIRERSESIEKSEVLELHAEESKCETSELESSKLDDRPKEEHKRSRDNQTPRDKKVSITEEKSDKKELKKAESSRNDKAKPTNDPDVVESSVAVEKGRKRDVSTDSEKDKDAEAKDRYRSRDLERSDSTQSAQEENVQNGQAPPLVISRKRRWGSSRTAKLSTQKSITISTDILKEIIPDVKPVEFEEVIEERKPAHKREVTEKIERPILPKIVIDNTENVELHKKEAEEKDKENVKARESNLSMNRKISIVKDNDSILTRPPSPPRYKQSNILYITNLVRPFTLPQLKNLLQRTGRISENGFWIDRIKSKCFVNYETEDQAVETRHALHGVTWPVSNPKTLQVDFSTQEAFDKAKLNEDTDNAQASTIPGTVEDWLREQDLKRERGEVQDKPWERKAVMREWDVGKNDKDKEMKDKLRKDDRSLDKRRHRTPERSPEPAKKFKKKEEEAPAKLLDDLFRKTKTTPCIYWLPLSSETIAVKEEQRRQHMAEHERRLLELRRTGHRRH